MIPLTDPTLPSPPFLYCPKLANLRDVGGYPLRSPTNSAARSVRRGLLYRSADPSYIDTEGLQILESAGVKRIYDLRSQPEVDRQGKEASAPPPPFWTRNDASEQDRQQPGTIIERVWAPVFATADYRPEKVGLRYRAYTRGAEGFREAYRDILEAGGAAYGRVLRDLAGAGAGAGAGAAALVHCSAGKDRTGVLVAVLYGLLGVEDAVVCAEYALTDVGLRLMKPLFKQRLLLSEALKGHEDGVDGMISANEENMRVTLELIREVWGGAEGYLRQVVGLTDEEIGGLRRNFESEEGPILGL